MQEIEELEEKKRVETPRPIKKQQIKTISKKIEDNINEKFIDLVYTWVNGSDPEFLKELRKAKKEDGIFDSQ